MERSQFVEGLDGDQRLFDLVLDKREHAWVGEELGHVGYGSRHDMWRDVIAKRSVED